MGGLQNLGFLNNRNRGKRWAIALIKKLWETAWDLWEHRNGILHEQENIVSRSMGMHLNHRISRVYQNLRSRPIRIHNKHLVHLPLRVLLCKPVHNKVQWLEVAEPALWDERQHAWQRRIRSACTLDGMRRCFYLWLAR